MSVWVLLMTAVPGWQSAAEPFGVSSASAILYEPERGLILYEKDIHTPRSMASTTKVMTGLLALEQGDLDREITVPAEAVRVEGSALGLRGGDTISMRDLVIGLLLESGNDAANVIAYVLDGSIPAFAERMNARCGGDRYEGHYVCHALWAGRGGALLLRLRHGSAGGGSYEE